MLLYNDFAERRSWLYGLLGVVVILSNYLAYPYRYGLSYEWLDWLPGIYATLTIIGVYLGFASLMVKVSSLRLLVFVCLMTAVYVIVTTGADLIKQGEFPPMIPVSSLLQAIGLAMVATLVCAAIEGMLWSWRDPTKRF